MPVPAAACSRVHPRQPLPFPARRYATETRGFTDVCSSVSNAGRGE